MVVVDKFNSQGFTPLMLASFNGDLGILTILLNKGASTSVVKDDGFTARHLAVEGGHLAVTKLLLEAGADLELKVPLTGGASLSLAADRRALLLSLLILKEYTYRRW